MTKNTTVLVPFDDLMEHIEMYLVDNGFIKPEEYLVFADLGFEVTNEGFVSIEVEVESSNDQVA